MLWLAEHVIQGERGPELAARKLKKRGYFITGLALLCKVAGGFLGSVATTLMTTLV